LLRLGALAALTALAGAMGYRNIFRYELSRQSFALPGLMAPLRAVQLSDLHYGPFLDEHDVSRWVSSAMQQRPDVVLLTGDFIDSRSQRDPAPLFAALKPLSAPLGVWAVWGNHDRISRARLQMLESEFTGLGFGILNNRSVRLRPDLQLAGIDDYRLGSPDVHAALAGREPGAATLLLSHNPDVLPELPAGSVELVLAGHTHGGQLSLPLIGPLVTGSRYGQRYAEGWVSASVPAYVNRGLGVSGLPLRAFCPPELTVFELVPA